MPTSLYIYIYLSEGYFQAGAASHLSNKAIPILVQGYGWNVFDGVLLEWTITNGDLLG